MQDNSSSPSGAWSKKLRSQEPNTAPQLLVEIAPMFNYAAWQNAVPLLKSIAIVNTHGAELSSVTVEMSASNGFARDKRWVIDRVGAGETLRLKTLDVDVDSCISRDTRRGRAGNRDIPAAAQGRTSPRNFPASLRILAKDEWGGMSTMGELLPAFVMPNEPALAALLRSAATVLSQAGHSTALDGYQSGDPTGVTYSRHRFVGRCYRIAGVR